MEAEPQQAEQQEEPVQELHPREHRTQQALTLVDTAIMQVCLCSPLACTGTASACCKALNSRPQRKSVTPPVCCKSMAASLGSSAETPASCALVPCNRSHRWDECVQADPSAALQAMLAMSDTGALLRFVQRPNSIELATGQEALQARGRYSELVALLAARDQGEAALDLLRQLSQAPQELSVPPEGTLEALQGSSENQIKRYSALVALLAPRDQGKADQYLLRQPSQLPQEQQLVQSEGMLDFVMIRALS